MENRKVRGKKMGKIHTRVLASLVTPCIAVGPENATLILNPSPAPDPISSGRPVPGKNVPLSYRCMDRYRTAGLS